jgi:hypothetical protein
VNCAFSFCWDAWFADESPSQHQDRARPPETADGPERGAHPHPTSPSRPAGPKPSARSAPGSTPGTPCNATGRPGRTRPTNHR